MRAQLQIHACVVLWGFTAILGKLISLPAAPLVWWRMLIVTVLLALVPRVWVLGLTHQSRVFQNMTVPEIVSKVLKDAGFTTSDYRLAHRSLHHERRRFIDEVGERDGSVL